MSNVVESGIVKRMIELNRAWYTSEEIKREIKNYKLNHPTKPIAVLCMDGRVDLTTFTGLPPRVIFEIDSMAGKFNFGECDAGNTLAVSLERAASRGKGVLLFCSYHFSRGNPARGCAGFHYDTRAAIDYALKLRSLMDDLLCNGGHSLVYPLTIGLETDQDAILFHHPNNPGEILDMSLWTGDEDSLSRELIRYVPDMNDTMRLDLAAMLYGNVKHIAELGSMDRPTLAMEHQENVIVVGRGNFRWLGQDKSVFSIGGYHETERQVAVALGIVIDNVNSGRVNRADGLALIISGVDYRNHLLSDRFAQATARNLAHKVYRILHEHYPNEAYWFEWLVGRYIHHTGEFRPFNWLPTDPWLPV